MRIHIQKPVSTSGSQNFSYGADAERLAFFAAWQKFVTTPKKCVEPSLAGPCLTTSSLLPFLRTGEER